MRLSVVIPTWNEADALPATLASVARVPEVAEVLVADGGSADATVALAIQAGARVVTVPKGRGRQCRAGAEAAKGDVLLFLHADTWLPADAGAAVARALRATPGRRPVVGGAFRKAFRDAPWTMRGARFRSWLWFRFTRRPFADQALWCPADALKEVGGFPDLPLMEEFEWARRLETVGDLVLLRPVVRTSARKFRKNGVVATYRLMASILYRYARGEDAESLRRRYERRG